MLKKVFVIALVLVFTFTLPFSTYAESLEQGLADVEDALPESVREYGLTAENTADFLDLGNVFSLLLSALKKAFSAAVVPFWQLLPFLSRFIFLNALLSDKDSPLQKTLCAVFAFGSLVSTFVSVFDVSSAVSHLDKRRLRTFGQSLSPSCFHVSVRRDEPPAPRCGFCRNGSAVFRVVFVGTELVVPCVNTFFAIRRDLFRLVERGSLFAVQKRLKNLRFRARRLLSRFLSFRRCTACACVGCRCNPSVPPLMLWVTVSPS